MKPRIALSGAELDQLVGFRLRQLLEIGAGDLLHFQSVFLLVRLFLRGLLVRFFLLRAGFLLVVAFGLLVLLRVGDLRVPLPGRGRRPDIGTELDPAEQDYGTENESQEEVLLLHGCILIQCRMQNAE